VGDRDSKLHRHERCRQGRVDVARHDDESRPLAIEHRLDALHHACGLNRVRSGAHLEHSVGLRNAQLLEEHLRHHPVVVLSGVDDHVTGVG
jgi:hypothetical protein